MFARSIRLLNGPEATTIYQATGNVSFALDNRGCQLSMHKVHDGILITNDLVDLKSETSLSGKERFDSVINSGGVKIHPEMVEQKLPNI